MIAKPALVGSKKRRRTRYITLPQANNLVAACEFARTIGYPLNVSIDVCWLMFSGYAEDRKRLAKCQQRLSKWFVRRDFQLRWIWVREIRANGALHTHILMHVPPWLMEDGVFQIAFERSFEPEGGPSHEKAILIKPAYSPHAKLAYMLKGMRRAEAIKFKVRASFQGEIEGKRVGTTQNVGPRARARSNSVATKLGRNIAGQSTTSATISSEIQTNSPCA